MFLAIAPNQAASPKDAWKSHPLSIGCGASSETMPMMTIYVKQRLMSLWLFAQINVQNIKQRISLWGSCSYPMFASCFNGGTCWAPETHGHDPWHTTMPRSTRRLQDKLKGCGEFGAYQTKSSLQVFVRNAPEPAIQEAFHYKLKTNLTFDPFIPTFTAT